MNGGSGGVGVSGEYDLCEMDEDLVNNNGAALADNISESSAVTTTSSATATTTQSHADLLESDISTSGGGGIVDGTGLMTAAALKSTIMKQQNGSNKIMSIAHSYNYTDDMLESEKSSLAGRVHDLERRVLTQQDEIVCLRSTLADVLRRVNQLEGIGSERQQQGHPMMSGGRTSSAPGTPARTNSVSSSRASPTPQQQQPLSHTFSNGSYSSSSTYNGSEAIRLRKPQPRPMSSTSSPNGMKGNSIEAMLRRNTMGSSGALSTNTRSRTSHQSNGSLHSDTQSSSSVSPAPSPSPRPQVQSQQSAGSPAGINTAGLGKRWSSTGDFNTQSPLTNRLSTKSLLNLASKTSIGPMLKHGTSTTSYNDEEGMLKMFMRGRPLHFYAPSEVRDAYDISQVNPAPSKKLKLDWVYGYRGKDCRQNLYQLPTGEMVYFVAAAVVLYNVDEQSQRHYLGHTDDVKSLAIHPNKLLVATGQCAGHDRKDAMPHVRVWNSVSLSTMAVIGMGDFQVSINCLSFSKSDGGALLVAIDDAPDKIISVWEWQRGDRGHRVTETRCSVDTVVAAEFHPLEKNSLITIGKGHVAFWTLDTGGALYKRMGVFEGREKPKYVTCLAFTAAGDPITGDSNGNLIAWGRGTNTISRFLKKAHDGPVFSLCALKDGAIVSGGGKDGRIVLYNQDLSRTGIETLIEPHFGPVRVVAEGKGSQLLVGTTRNCILTGSLELGFMPVVMGHTDELWGLASHPNMPQFVTGGFDRLLQLWDSLSHSVVWSKDIGEQIQSCSFSPDGEIIIVGGASGRWMAFDTQSRELLGEHVDGQEAIQTVKFSPDGRLLALGSRDNAVYMYQSNNGGRRYAKIGKCTGHASFIVHLDWSTDGQVLRTNSGDYETLYWNPTTCRQIANSATVRDCTWATNTCTLTFQSIGIWPDNADGTDVNTASTSSDLKLIASGDDWGKVKLYHYPASQPKSLSHAYNGHSSHVTAVEFLHDDTRLISTGGNDTSVMQWVVA